MKTLLTAVAALALAFTSHGATASAQVRVAASRAALAPVASRYVVPSSWALARPTVRVRPATSVRIVAPVAVGNRVIATQVARPTAAASQPATTRRVAPAPVPAPGPGQAQCVVTENGGTSRGQMEIRTLAGAPVASGDCRLPLDVPAGDYLATLTLTTALDRPTRTVPLRVTEGGLAVARADFATAILEVRFTSGGQQSYGRALIYRDGEYVGSIGGGIVTRVSAGTYTVRAQHLRSERTYEVPLAPGQRRAVLAPF